MRDITAQLESYQEHLDTLYPAISAEEVDRTGIDSETVLLHPHRGPRRFLAFAAAFMLVIGLGLIAFFLRSDEAVTPAEEVPPSVITPTTATATTTPSAAPSSTAITPTTIRSTSLADVPMGPLDPNAWQTKWGIAPDGGFAAVYWHEADHELRMLRCTDTDCTGSPEVITLGAVEPEFVEGEERGPYPEDLVFGPDGSPVVLMSGGESGAEFSLYACEDQDCSAVLTAPFDEGTWPAYGALAVAPDGGLRVLYVDAETESLNLAICDDPVCETVRRTITVEKNIQIPSKPGIRIAPDGRTFIEYEADGAVVRARVAVCTDPECSDGPTIFAFEEAMTPRTTHSDEGRFFVWYRSGPFMIGEGDMVSEAISEAFGLMVAECDATSCGPPQPIDVGWETLRAWGFREDLRLLGTTDGGLVIPQYWSPAACDFLFEVARVDLEDRAADTVMGPLVGMFDATTVTDDGEPLLLRVDEGGDFRMINLAEVTPSASGPVVSRCASP